MKKVKRDFDFKKFVTESKATLAGRLSTVAEKAKSADDEFSSDEFEKEPTKKDLKSSPSITGTYKKREQLAALVRQKDSLVAKLKSGELTIDQYRREIGTIPQQIKTLTADLASIASIEDEGDEVEEQTKNIEEDEVPPALNITPDNFFEEFEDSDVNGPGCDMAIQQLIEDFKERLQSVPENVRLAGRIAIKQLWFDRIKDWKS